MSLVSQPIKSLVNGVSQQAPALRLPSQAERQVNCVSSAVDGLKRRPPSRHIAKLSSGTSYGSAFIHLIDRDASERYAAVFLDTDLEVYDLATGAEKTVTFPNGKGYLDCVSPKSDMRAVTAADFTFVVNRSVKTQMTADLSPVRVPEALMFFRAGSFRETFSVNLNGMLWEIGLPKQDSGLENTYALQSNTIAAHMHQWLTTNTLPVVGGSSFFGASPGYSATSQGFVITRQGSLLHITRSDGADFTISTSDGGGDEHLISIKGVMQRFNELPKYGVDGFLVKIEGSPEDDGTDFWVQFKSTI